MKSRRSAFAVVVSGGRSAIRVDDRNAIITYERCGHSAAYAREDGEVLTSHDMVELMGATGCGCDEA